MRKYFFLFVAVLVIAVVIKTTPFVEKISYVFFQLIFTNNIALKSTNDEINILVLGIGGGAHEGPDLTDTIIFANINQKINKISLVSIPRDLWVPDLSGKINIAYAIGEEKRKGGGITLAQAAVSKIVGYPIDYVVVINFDGFLEAVNLVGGLDISVDNTLDDPNYPIEGAENNTCGHTPEEIQSFVATDSAEADLWNFLPCRYEHLYIDKGPTHMDGKTALKFVRSRHAIGDEGTDFARSKRQAKVINAFKQKVLSVQTLLNPITLLSLYDSVSKNINTNITKDEIDDFVRLTQKMQDAKVQSTVLDIGDEATSRQGFLSHPDISNLYQNQWVLIPQAGNGDFLEIQKYISCFFLKDATLCGVK